MIVTVARRRDWTELPVMSLISNLSSQGHTLSVSSLAVTLGLAWGYKISHVQSRVSSVTVSPPFPAHLPCTPGQQRLATMEFLDYRKLPDLAKWCIFISSVLSIILGNVGAITLFAITAHRDHDNIIAAMLIASSSAIAHTLQVMSTPPHSNEFPHVRKVLVGLLIAASVAHVVSIFYLGSTHDEFFNKLSKLVCFFHGILAEVGTISSVSPFSFFPG